MVEYLWYYIKCGLVITILILVLAIASGCSEARFLTQDQAYAYCRTHTAGTALGMNPLGEEYATWMSYCNPAWVQQTAPGFVATAGVWQNQQMIDRMQPVTPAYRLQTVCSTQGVFTTCQ